MKRPKTSKKTLTKIKDMEYTHIIGIDVSKDTLDFSVRDQQKALFYLQTSNDAQGLNAFEKACKAKGIDLLSSLLYMEHTGIYNAASLSHFHSKGYAIWLENAIQIKRSMGMVRGKNDKIDAERIGAYASRFQDKMRLWEPEREVLSHLRHLSALRRRLLDAKNRLKIPLQETRGRLKKTLQNQLEKLSKRSMEALEANIKAVEGEIRALIRSDERLDELFTQVCSVRGAGNVLFCEMVIATNEFKTIREAKKFACYAGVAPFEHSSGTSIRGKNRV